MNKTKTILLTGATGLVGSYLLKIFLHHGYKVYALARRKDNESAQDRILGILKFWDEDVLSQYYDNLKVIESDVTDRNLGLEKRMLELLISEVDEIFHSAAVTQFNWPLNKIRNVNVVGTEKVLNFAMECKKNGKLKKVNYLSTVYVCGDHKGVFEEKDLDVGQEFNTTYEQSKFEAEMLIKDYRAKGLWVDIFRPPLVLGESQSGKTIAFKQHVYQLLHMWNLNIFDYFPGKETHMNFVFVDDLCLAIIAISSNTSSVNKTYHLFNEKRVSLESIADTASEFLNFRRPALVSSSNYRDKNPTPAQKILVQNNILLFNDRVILHSKNTNEVLNTYDFKLSTISRDLFLNQLIFCVKEKLLKRNYAEV